MSPVTQFNNAPQDPAMKKKGYVPLVLLVTSALAVVTFYGTVRSTHSVDTALAANNNLVRTGGSVHVCGEKRTVPNGSVPIKNIPQFRTGEWGLVDDENQGANPDNYKRQCTNNGFPLPVGEPGNGLLSNLAIGSCNGRNGCPLYRVFDVKPEYNEVNLFIARMEGRSWAPFVSLEDTSGEKGKTFSEFAQDMGICRWEYASSPVGVDGSLGGFLVKCNVPSGDLFFFGEGQSMDCRNEDGDDFRIPPSPDIQIMKDSCELESCEYCATKDYDPIARDAPDVLECDGGWTALTSDNNPKGKVYSCSF